MAPTEREDEGVTPDEEVREFFDRLEESMFSLADLTADPADQSAELKDFLVFRAQCEAREKAGRDRWGDEYLTRDNCIEATEEAADLANYAMFDILQARTFGEEEDWNIALTAAKYAALAHAWSRALRKKRHEQYSDFPAS